MQIKTILISFVDIEPYYLNISDKKIDTKTSNESTSPICNLCDKKYCLMSYNIKKLVLYFNKLKSYSQGRITMFNVNNSELIIQGDAQKLFIYSILSLITNYKCQLFGDLSKYIQYYDISINYEDFNPILYIMLSSHLMSLFSTKKTDVNLDKILKKTKSDINNIKQFLSSLIEYVNNELQSVRRNHGDAAINGVTLLYDFLYLVEDSISQDFNIKF